MATVHVQYRLSADTGIVRRESFYLKTKPFRPSEEEAPKFLEQEQIPVGEGRYTMELQLSEDAWPAGKYYFRDTINILPGCPQYSSLLLLDTAIDSKKPSAFQRNGWQLLPRPLPFYDEGERTVQAYFELYNKLCNYKERDYPMYQTFFLSKEKGVRDLPRHMLTDTIATPSNLQYFLCRLSTATLPSGNYWLNVNLRSISGNEVASSAVFFQTLNKHPEAEAPIAGSIADTSALTELSGGRLLDLSKTFVGKFDMAQMRAILKMLRPGADAADEVAIHGFLNRPDALYMRFFIYNHFAQRNRGEPGKAWKEFTDVVREVNHRFNAGGTMGYETDRGIIYLRYGKPDEEVRVPNEAGALPYEIWRYNANPKMHGPGLFLFYSPGSAVSGYRLLNSTVMGETQNADWRSVLYVGGQSSGNANARAEEYFGR